MRRQTAKAGTTATRQFELDLNLPQTEGFDSDEPARPARPTAKPAASTATARATKSPASKSFSEVDAAPAAPQATKTQVSTTQARAKTQNETASSATAAKGKSTAPRGASHATAAGTGTSSALINRTSGAQASSSQQFKWPFDRTRSDLLSIDNLKRDAVLAIKAKDEEMFRKYGEETQLLLAIANLISGGSSVVDDGFREEREADDQRVTQQADPIAQVTDLKAPSRWAYGQSLAAFTKLQRLAPVTLKFLCIHLLLHREWVILHGNPKLIAEAFAAAEAARATTRARGTGVQSLAHKKAAAKSKRVTVRGGSEAGAAAADTSATTEDEKKRADEATELEAKATAEITDDSSATALTASGPLIEWPAEIVMRMRQLGSCDTISKAMDAIPVVPSTMTPALLQSTSSLSSTSSSSSTSSKPAAPKTRVRAVGPIQTSLSSLTLTRTDEEEEAAAAEAEAQAEANDDDDGSEEEGGDDSEFTFGEEGCKRDETARAMSPYPTVAQLVVPRLEEFEEASVELPWVYSGNPETIKRGIKAILDQDAGKEGGEISLEAAARAVADEYANKPPSVKDDTPDETRILNSTFRFVAIVLTALWLQRFEVEGKQAKERRLVELLAIKPAPSKRVHAMREQAFELEKQEYINSNMREFYGRLPFTPLALIEAEILCVARSLVDQKSGVNLTNIRAAYLSTMTRVELIMDTDVLTLLDAWSTSTEFAQSKASSSSSSR